MSTQTFKRYLTQELWRAYYDARAGKRNTNDEHCLEIRGGTNIINLRDSIMARQYHPSRGVAFIICDPVMREIVAAPFRDRIVHHLIFNTCAEWWDRRFIYDSYSCRIGKGTLFGQKRLSHHIHAAMQGGRERAFVAKLDIQGYFMSLDHDKLYTRALWGLRQQFFKSQNDCLTVPEEDRERLYKIMKYLWREIIYDKPMKNVTTRGRRTDWKGLPRNKSLFFQPAGRGIVIGNLTSQLLSNIYLDQLDRFITFDLGYKHYGRYVDDFYIVVPESQREQLLHDVTKIECFLRNELLLTLHPKKRHFQYADRGVPFVGAVVYPGRILPSQRAKHNFYTAAYKFVTQGKGDLEGLKSRQGCLKHINSRRFFRRAYDIYGWEYDWLPEKEYFKFKEYKRQRPEIARFLDQSKELDLDSIRELLNDADTFDSLC